MKSSPCVRVCPHCGAPLPIDMEKETIACEYCSTRFRLADVLNESREDSLQRRKLVRAEKELAAQKERAKQLQKSQEEAEGRNYRRSFGGVVCMMFVLLFLLGALSTFAGGGLFRGLLLTLQAVLLLSNWLIGAKYVKKRSQRTRFLLKFSVFLLFFLYAQFK